MALDRFFYLNRAEAPLYKTRIILFSHSNLLAYIKLTKLMTKTGAENQTKLHKERQRSNKDHHKIEQSNQPVH